VRSLAVGDHPPVFRLAIAIFLLQAGYHGFTASVPLALARAGRPDAEIGAIVGVAPLVQIPAALVGGALIDRLGSIRMIALGALAYLLGSAILLLPGLDTHGSTLQFVLARLLQGTGFGFVMPSVLALVPRLVPAVRRGVALATAQVAHNLTFVALPPLSIVVLDLYGLSGVAVLVLGMVAIAVAVTFVRRFDIRGRDEEVLHEARRKLGFAFRRTWAAPLAVIALFVIHWGVVVAYLPQRAEAAGANIGLFFAADGVLVLLTRLPAGWMADRVAPAWQILLGLALTAAGVVLLLPSPTTPVLVLAGALTGGGAAFITVPVTLTLARRSNDADRGSAFSLFSACFAGAIALGSIGSAPLIGTLGYELVLTLSLVGLGGAAAITVLDREMGAVPGRKSDAIEAEKIAVTSTET
jgi:MFS family permease